MSVDLEKSDRPSGSMSGRSGRTSNDEPAAPATTPASSSKTPIMQDLRILPTLIIIYFLTLLDRSAAQDAVKLKHSLFGHASGRLVSRGIFYLGFILFVLPTTILVPKLGAKIMLICLLAGSGAITLIQAAVSSYGGLAATQFFLGAFQAGIFATMVMYLSTVYKRSELAFRLAVVFGFGACLASFNGPISVHLVHMARSSHLAGWQVLVIIEGALAVAFAPLALLLPSTKSETTAQSTELPKVHFGAFTIIALFLGISSGACQNVIKEMVKTLSTGSLPESYSLVAIATFGLVILLPVAASSDLYLERSTHLAVPLLISLVSIVNNTLDYYINKRDPAYYNSFILNVCVYCSPPLLLAWFCNNTARVSTATKAMGVGLVVGAYHVGELLGWIFFIHAKVTTSDAHSEHGSSSSGSGSAHGKRSETTDVDDLKGLKAAAAFMGFTVLLIFAYGAWLKKQERAEKRSNGIDASEESVVS